MIVTSTGIIRLSPISLKGTLEHDRTVDVNGSIDVSGIILAGIASIDEEIIIASISKEKGRWGDQVTMVVENLPEYYSITLGKIPVEILEIDGNKITWKVPDNVPIGNRLLEINVALPPLSSFILLESNQGYILLENGSQIALEGD